MRGVLSGLLYLSSCVAITAPEYTIAAPHAAAALQRMAKWRPETFSRGLSFVEPAPHSIFLGREGFVTHGTSVCMCVCVYTGPS